MITAKLIILCFLFTDASCQESQHAGKEMALWDSADHTTSPDVDNLGNSTAISLLSNAACCFQNNTVKMVTCSQGVSCADQCSALGGSLCLADDRSHNTLAYLNWLDPDPKMLRWCWRTARPRCPVLRYPQCCSNLMCSRMRPRNCQWTNYLAGSVQPVQVGSEEILKIDSKVNQDLVGLISNKANHFWEKSIINHRSDAEGETSVTLCDETGSSEELSAEQLAGAAQQISDATCAFIVYEEDSTATCADVAAHCQPAQRNSLVTMACWRLKWCPGKIKNKYSLLSSKKDTYGICCYHPRYMKRTSHCTWAKFVG